MGRDSRHRRTLIETARNAAEQGVLAVDLAHALMAAQRAGEAVPLAVLDQGLATLAHARANLERLRDALGKG